MAPQNTQDHYRSTLETRNIFTPGNTNITESLSALNVFLNILSGYDIFTPLPPSGHVVCEWPITIAGILKRAGITF